MYVSNPSGDRSAAGVIHDRGNLIRVALSALDRVAHEPWLIDVYGSWACNRHRQDALQHARALVMETVGGAAPLDTCLNAQAEHLLDRGRNPQAVLQD